MIEEEIRMRSRDYNKRHYAKDKLDPEKMRKRRLTSYLSKYKKQQTAPRAVTIWRIVHEHDNVTASVPDMITEVNKLAKLS